MFGIFIITRKTSDFVYNVRSYFLVVQQLCISGENTMYRSLADIVIQMSRDIGFPTIWHFDK